MSAERGVSGSITGAAAQLGLSETTPLVWFAHDEPKALSEYPEPIQEEVIDILENTYADVVALIGDDWDFVNSVAEALIKRRALSHADFIRLDRRPGPLPPRPAPVPCRPARPRTDEPDYFAEAVESLQHRHWQYE